MHHSVEEITGVGHRIFPMGRVCSTLRAREITVQDIEFSQLQLQYVKSRGNYCAGHIFSQRAGFAVPEEQGGSLCRTLIYTMGVAVREVRGKSLVQDISIAHWAGFAVRKV